MKQCSEENLRDITDVMSIDRHVCLSNGRKIEGTNVCNARRELFDEFIVIYNNTVVPKPTSREASSRWIFVMKKNYEIKDHVYNTYTYVHAPTVETDTIVYDRKLKVCDKAVKIQV